MASGKRPNEPKQRPENGNKGRFQPGNPGRPRGARHRVTVAVEELLEGEADKLTRKCIKAALAGDMTAMRLCMERIAPPRRGRPTPFTVPPIETAADVPKAVSALLVAIGAGTLSAEEAQGIMTVVEGSRRAFEMAELVARLEALEARTGGSR